jgi:hypothetical protein
MLWTIDKVATRHFRHANQMMARVSQPKFGGRAASNDWIAVVFFGSSPDVESRDQDRGQYSQELNCRLDAIRIRSAS